MQTEEREKHPPGVGTPTDHGRPAPDFSDLFREHFGLVWNSLRRLGIEARDLDDLTHEVFMTVHKRLRDYDPNRPFGAWVFGIAYRVACHYHRTIRRRPEVLEDSLEVADKTDSADEQIEKQQIWQLVQRALHEIDLDQRAVFIMHEIDGHTVPEIAQALDINLSTAYSRLRLATERFTRAVDRLRQERGDS